MGVGCKKEGEERIRPCGRKFTTYPRGNNDCIVTSKKPILDVNVIIFCLSLNDDKDVVSTNYMLSRYLILRVGSVRT